MYACISPWGQALALAYREASKEITKSGKANEAWVVSRVALANGSHPTRTSLRDFFLKVDADPDWFPGMHSGKKRGPAPLLTSAKRRAVACMPTSTLSETVASNCFGVRT